MKRIKNTIILLLLSVFVFSACEKELDTEGISKITYFADFKMKGDKVMTVVKGEAFHDPGVTAQEDGKELTITSTVLGSAYIVPGKTQPSDVTYTKTIDTNKPGMYVITYSAKNSDGFSATAERLVFVLEEPADPAVDLTGTYASGTSPEGEITKVADGVFYATNAWGGGSTVKIGAYMICTVGISINVPQQESLVRFYGYGTRNPADGKLDLRMTRPTFSPPLVDQVKIWVKK